MPTRLALAAAAALSLLLPTTTAGAAASWQWPLAGTPVVTRPFAPGPTPWSPGHRGADLAGLRGEPVLAAGAGRVTYAGQLAGRGVVTVTHGALRTTYEPVSASVRVGGLVRAGDPIGALVGGHAGCPVEACLHWGLRRGQDYLDPVRLVRAGPVRLLTPGEPVASTSARLGSLSGRGAVVGASAGARWGLWSAAQSRTTP
jgi:murein DD-endopeptidase MepM/ murein hydrolase activator NlpD